MDEKEKIDEIEKISRVGIYLDSESSECYSLIRYGDYFGKFEIEEEGMRYTPLTSEQYMKEINLGKYLCDFHCRKKDPQGIYSKLVEITKKSLNDNKSL